MFNYYHVQAIFIQLFINFITNNTAKVNELLSNPNCARTTTPLFSCGSLRIDLRKNSDNKWEMIIPAFGDVHIMRMGTKFAINKRIINDLNVWFHRVGRDYHEKGLNYIYDKVADVNVKPTILSIGILDRLLQTPARLRINYGNNLVNELMPATVTIKRNLFNKLKLHIEIVTPIGNSLISSQFPVHFGIIREYDANHAKDPVNTWVGNALLDHVETYLAK